MTEVFNPLRSYFRQPAIYVKLPSLGKFWPPGSIDFPSTGEVGVMPMTAKDELTLKVPDALLNGQAVVDVIQSCVPSIKNAWDCPTLDFEILLAAIRIASFGEKLEISTTCPCDKKETLDYVVNLHTVVDFLSNNKFEDMVTLTNGLTLKLKPLSYRELSKTQIKIWEQQKIFTIINDESMDPVIKQEKFNESFTVLTAMNISIITNMIEAIVMPDNTLVDNQDYILEFVNNAGRDVFESVQNKISQIKDKIELKPMKVKCTQEGCDREFELPINLNQSNFFG